MQKRKRVRWYNNPNRCEYYFFRRWITDDTAKNNILVHEIEEDEIALVKSKSDFGNDFLYFVVRQKEVNKKCK